MTTHPGLRRSVAVDEVMGTRASAHVILHDGVPEAVAEGAVEAALDSLHQADRRFSPFRDDSQVSAIARGELSLDDAHPDVREVEAACRDALARTDGRFSAWWRGWFDPTGYVKGWAVDQAVERHLLALLEVDGVAAVGLNVGGDLRVATAPGADWTWRVGIADPLHHGEVLATLELVDGAVATSGTAERGAHVVDPRTGERALSVLSATVVSATLAHADLWATTALVAGIDDLSWIAAAGTRSGLLAGSEGRVRRWAGSVEVALVDGADATTV
ncbi:MAG: FAD:protein FMN transferase [Promicromonosporaceae bacterium]|nr:FAD:protein FMN transferase [Promicromonosporaceae bacterium]